MKAFLFKGIVTAVLFIFANYAFAWHTSGGKIKNINVYSATDAVLVTLVNPTTNEAVHGADVGDCSNKTTFAINPSLPAERRSQMLSVLLMAKASDRRVSLSYSTTGGCTPYGSNRDVYRSIVRIIL